MLIKSIKLKNFLSFGESAEPVDLQSLNIVIGPNGSGKSNLIEAIELIRSAPKDLLTPFVMVVVCATGFGKDHRRWRQQPLTLYLRIPRGQQACGMC